MNAITTDTTTTSAPATYHAGPRIYVASLADYNDGRLLGTWIDLDGKDVDAVTLEINEMLARSKSPNVMRRWNYCADCGAKWASDSHVAYTTCRECGDGTITVSAEFPSAEEYAIHDHEGFYGVRIEEYTPMAEVVKIAEAFNDADNPEAFAAFLADRGDLDDAIENFAEAFQGEWDSEEDFAENLVDVLGYLDQMPDHLRGYFDYKAFTRDLFIGDYTSERLDNGNVAVFSRF